MTYRPDIQILRGIAVLYVLLFHFGIPGADNGFLGVDIFFVISGFLMAVLYTPGQALSFWIRRARRLLPAYYAVIILTLGAGFVLTTPNETAQVVSQSLFATGFSSNIGFWLQNSYFSKLEFNPLLHLWSLGVEFQFYLIVPLLVWCFLRLRMLLVITLLLSLVLCFLVTEISPKTSFFLLPFRLWEFLIGFYAAWYFTNQGNTHPSRFDSIGLLASLCLLGLPMIPVDAQKPGFLAGHPGLLALAISLATALILARGLPARITGSVVGKLLSKLGDYSYSIYLAHFPIIVLYLSQPFAGTVLAIADPLDYLNLMVITLCLSWLLHRYVEQAGRRWSMRILVPLACALILTVTSIFPILEQKGLSIPERAIFQAFSDRATYRCGKWIRVIEPGAVSCKLTAGDTSSRSVMMLIGNSHADAIKSTLARIAHQSGFDLRFVVANNPLMPGGPDAQTLVGDALTHGVSRIVLHYSPAAVSAAKLKEFIEIASSNDISVAFVEPVPVWPEQIPRRLYEHRTSSRELPLQSRSDYVKKNRRWLSEIEAIEEESFARYTVVDTLCTPECAYVTEAGLPLYYDASHLTLTGSALLAPVFEKILSDWDSEMNVKN